MIPISTYLSWAKDALIIGAIVFVLWFVYHHGGDATKLKDIQALQAQMELNTQTVEGWAAQQSRAEVQHDQDMAEIKSRISANAAPLWMCRPPNTRPVSDPAPRSQNGNTPSQSGPADTGTRVDIRGAISAFELKYEQALADCRRVIASWPR